MLRTTHRKNDRGPGVLRQCFRWPHLSVAALFHQRRPTGRGLRTCVAFALLAAFAPAAFAQAFGGSVAITPPTQRTDGSALPAAQIAAYEIYFQCDTTPVIQGAPATSTPVVRDPLFPTEGTYHVCSRVQTTDGQFSAFGPIYIAQPFTTAPPNASSITEITVTCSNGQPAIETVITGGKRFECGP